MKKLAITTLFGLMSTAVFAAPVGNTFTGFGVGVDLTTTKYKEAKRATGVGIIVDYGMDYGNDFVGLIEGKVKLNSSKLLDEKNENELVRNSLTGKEKFRGSISYLQGYRVLPDLLPYVKVGYTFTKLEAEHRQSTPNSSFEQSISDTNSGFGFGAGVKYAVSSNFELGAEYLRNRTKFDGGNVNSNTFGASATYRF